MKQYLDLLQAIQDRGVHKPAARENMPGTISLFGYQFRHDLSDGFPLLTTKKIYWKGVVIELLWFLRGDTNIKFLVDNGVNIWNEDAYNFYLKMLKDQKSKASLKSHDPIDLQGFIDVIKDGTLSSIYNGYKYGDCGYQYGKVWRNWSSYAMHDNELDDSYGYYYHKGIVDQIQNLIKSLKETPESRRHIVTAIDPAHDQNLALYWCHAMFQFNCRPLKDWDRKMLLAEKTGWEFHMIDEDPSGDIMDACDQYDIPKYYLDCQLYQRSADVILGVPFNIASYALLTHILAKICNMVPGEFIHTFGDVHIYDNHMEAVEEQLKREPGELPTLEIKGCPQINWNTASLDEILKSISGFEMETFLLDGYNPQSKIKAKLSTGL